MSLEISHVHKTFRKTAPFEKAREVEALVDVSFQASSGELVGIVGPSGSGKSTLLRIAACQLAADSGSATLDGTSIPRPSSSAGAAFRSKHVGFVFQEFGLVEEDTAVANVALPLRYSGLSARRASGMAFDLLEEFGLEDQAEAIVSELSAGQRQRVALARATVVDPTMILADEPTSNLDPQNRDLVLSTLLSCAAKGKIVVMATHDSASQAACHRRVTMSHGRLV